MPKPFCPAPGRWSVLLFLGEALQLGFLEEVSRPSVWDLLRPLYVLVPSVYCHINPHEDHTRKYHQPPCSRGDGSYVWFRFPPAHFLIMWPWRCAQGHMIESAQMGIEIRHNYKPFLLCGLLSLTPWSLRVVSLVQLDELQRDPSASTNFGFIDMLNSHELPG